MGFLDRLLGREDRSQPGGGRQAWPTNADPYGQQSAAGYRYGQQSYDVPPGAARTASAGSSTPPSEDELAVERYRYLLRTAPPERIEDVHAEAFARLTPEQRRMVFDELSRTAPAGEAPRADDPRSLAQAATRSEIRQPGTLERSLGGWGGGYGGRGAYGGASAFGGGFGGYGRSGSGFGSMLGASLLGSVAGYVIGSTIMSAFLPEPGMFGEPVDASGADDGGDGSGDDGGGGGDGGDGSGGDGSGADGTDVGADGGGYEAAGWDSGSGLDAGSDWGGGFDQDLGGFDV